MGCLGAHPHIVSVFDLGEHEEQPFIVTEFMGGGDVEGLLEKAGGPFPVERSLEIAKAVCRGLVFVGSSAALGRGRPATLSKLGWAVTLRRRAGGVMRRA